jgi:SAM-dependent methyltransferase
MSSPRYDDSLFSGTADFYSRFRPGIPAEVAEMIASEAKLDGTGRLLDVGTGTGQVLLALAPSAELSVGIEPDPDMLSEARRALDDGGLAGRVVLEQRRAPDLPREYAPYRLVTFGRVFHWVDRPATSRAVFELLEPGGSIAVFGDGSFWTGDEEWHAIVRDVVQRRLGPGRRAGGSSYSEPGEPFEESLRGAGFASVRQFRVESQRTWTVDSVIGYLYSTSFARRDLFGAQLARFERDLTDELLHYSPSGHFNEAASFDIWMGEKPVS